MFKLLFSSCILNKLGFFFLFMALMHICNLCVCLEYVHNEREVGYHIRKGSLYRTHKKRYVDVCKKLINRKKRLGKVVGKIGRASSSKETGQKPETDKDYSC